MKVKDVIIKACDFVNKDDLAKSLVDGSALSEEDFSLQEKLVKCFNLIREEIASEYQPILQVEKFTVKNFKLELSSFSNDVLEIYSIKDKYGRNVHYKIFDGYIFVCGKEVEVIYSTPASTLTIDDDFSSSLPERIFAYGVAREYFFINSLYEDANIWEERFKGSLQIMLRRKSEIKMPRRSWI
ncbi:MAG: hypothetical protein IJX25_04700 [Clostridia bacterium]|nr:hypothetical protein [Clostridia bacterium]